jgi:hypothetical protein
MCHRRDSGAAARFSLAFARGRAWSVAGRQGTPGLLAGVLYRVTLHKSRSALHLTLHSPVGSCMRLGFASWNSGPNGFVAEDAR